MLERLEGECAAARDAARVVRVCMRCGDVMGVEAWRPPPRSHAETTGLCDPCCHHLIAALPEARPAFA